MSVNVVKWGMHATGELQPDVAESRIGIDFCIQINFILCCLKVHSWAQTDICRY